MKVCYFIDPSIKIIHIIKIMQRYGYKIKILRIWNDNIIDLAKINKKFRILFKYKSQTSKEILEIQEKQKTYVINKKENFMKNFEVINANDLKLNYEDIVLSFEEDSIFEASIIYNKILKPLNALTYSAKHIIYRKLKKKFIKVKSIEDIKNAPDDKYILKPSLNSMGKNNVFILNHNQDYDKILLKDKDIFSLNRIFILEKYIKHVEEIWAMTLFDSKGDPYILWFSTEKNHATFSVFEEDLYREIKNINRILKIKKWMAFMQFLIDEYGNLHFIDLNPRLPGDDNWHELLYKYLTGKSFAKTIVDLILFDKTPKIIKSNKYIMEEEFDPIIPIKKNQKMWNYSDNYKEKPLLTFKKLDLYSNLG